MSNELLFLGFIVGEQGNSVDEKKVQVIRDWPISSTNKCIEELSLLS